MTPTQFDRIVAASRINPAKPSAAAARLVLIDGLSAQDAASRVGLNRRTVDRCVARIVARHQPPQVCPTCGHATGR
jgi:predicted DNA-binding protein (UPF0251 family)